MNTPLGVTSCLTIISLLNLNDTPNFRRRVTFDIYIQPAAYFKDLDALKKKNPEATGPCDVANMVTKISTCQTVRASIRQTDNIVTVALQKNEFT